jgi:hypothetical protein
MGTAVGAVRRLGKFVSFYPTLARIFGIEEAIFLGDMIYWTPRAENSKGPGWVYKSAEEIELKTCLTYRQQTRVRENLVERGVLAEEYDREKHRMWFKIDEESLDEHLTKCKVPPNELSEGTLPKVSSFNTESKTESTSDPSSTGSSYKNFKTRWRSAFGFSVGNDKRFKEQYAILCNRFGEDAVLDAIDEFVVDRGKPEKGIAAGIKNFIVKGFLFEDAEVILESEPASDDEEDGDEHIAIGPRPPKQQI